MSKTILSVDDSASVLQMVKLTLTGGGYAVVQAGNGAEGLAKARGGGIDMVLTDLNMPVMNGIAMIRELRKLPQCTGMPIIFLTTESAARHEAGSQGGRRHRLDHQAVPAGPVAGGGAQGAGHMSHTDPAQTYRQEAAELLDQLEQALLDLEHRRTMPTWSNTAFRALHTIKGSGAMFGFDAVAAFTHHVETAFDRVRRGEVAVAPPLIAVTLAAKDQIRRLIEQPDDADEAEGAAILDRLQAALGAPAIAPPHPSATTWRLGFRLPRDAMAMGTNPLLLLDELRALGPCTVVADTSTIPPLEALNPSECHIGWEVTLTTVQPRSAIEQVFLFVLDDMQLDLEPVSDRPPAPTDVAPAEARPVAPADGKSAASPDARPAATPHPDVPPRIAGSIRVPAERLDELMDQVGELVIAQSRLKQIAAASTDGQVKAIAEEIERLALELRDTTMGARLVPIGQLFGRFRRLVHDLAHDLGKEMTLGYCPARRPNSTRR